MSNEPTADYKPTDLYQFSYQLEKFIGDAKRSRDVSLRWFADSLISTLQLTKELKHGLSQENKIKVLEFQALELENEINARDRENAKTKRDLDQIRKKIAICGDTQS